MEKIDKKQISKTIRVGITHGDCNGIGYEVILKTLANPVFLEYCIPVIYGVEYVMKEYLKVLNIQDFKYNLLKKDQVAVSKKVNLIDIQPDFKKLTIGKSTEDSGKLALKSLEEALKDLKNNKINFFTHCNLVFL